MPTTEILTLSLHDALPIFRKGEPWIPGEGPAQRKAPSLAGDRARDGRLEIALDHARAPAADHGDAPGVLRKPDGNVQAPDGRAVPPRASPRPGDRTGTARPALGSRRAPRVGSTRDDASPHPARAAVEWAGRDRVAGGCADESRVHAPLRGCTHPGRLDRLYRIRFRVRPSG